MRSGWLYLMINFPLVVFVKIGITGKTVKGRARQIDRAVFGIPVPIMVMYLPAVRRFETGFHRLFSPLSTRFYRGDGSTEWFLFLAGLPVFLLGVLYWWGVYLVVINLHIIISIFIQ
jgi:hypothetical protein